MSGKKRRPGQSSSNGWGGARAGSGPKPGRKPACMLPDSRVKAMLRNMRKAKRECGVDEDDFLIKIITEGKVPWKDRPDVEVTVKDAITCTKIFKDFTIPKSSTSEQNITVSKDKGMAIRLPPKLPDPALAIKRAEKEPGEGINRGGKTPDIRR